VDSRHSSRCARGRALESRGAVAALVALLASLAAGCSTVKPQDKELLADPAMNYGAGGEALVQEEHVLANREGAAGAGRSSGGGCGCN
jgi:hypothetical protein